MPINGGIIMSETNQKIMNMILQNASVNEISKATGLSNKQLFYRLNMLRVKGYNFSRKYYYDGEIVYKLQKGFDNPKEISLLTSPSDKEFKAVFISDLHLSNKHDRVDLLNQIYDFCAKEGIHIIINGGDIIDGFLGFENLKKFKTIEEQINYFLKHYPYDKNILNFTCLGNHDYDVLEKVGQNLETILLQCDLPNWEITPKLQCKYADFIQMLENAIEKIPNETGAKNVDWKGIIVKLKNKNIKNSNKVELLKQNYKAPSINIQITKLQMYLLVVLS